MYNPSMLIKKIMILHYKNNKLFKIIGIRRFICRKYFCNISTKPNRNFTESDQIKKEKIKIFKKMYSECELTIFAWEIIKKHQMDKKNCKKSILYKLSKKGIPMHPLYLKKNLSKSN